jgi:hypothetical protein
MKTAKEEKKTTQGMNIQRKFLKEDCKTVTGAGSKQNLFLYS